MNRQACPRRIKVNQVRVMSKMSVTARKIVSSKSETLVVRVEMWGRVMADGWRYGVGVLLSFGARGIQECAVTASLWRRTK
jgi:hypothetical protein